VFNTKINKKRFVLTSKATNKRIINKCLGKKKLFSWVRPIFKEFLKKQWAFMHHKFVWQLRQSKFYTLVWYTIFFLNLSKFEKNLFEKFIDFCQFLDSKKKISKAENFFHIYFWAQYKSNNIFTKFQENWWPSTITHFPFSQNCSLINYKPTWQRATEQRFGSY
jgi:hypothetical protein